jgi:hypothetical protein
MPRLIIHTHARSNAIKRTLIAAGILLFLLIAGGIGYTYYTGLQDAKNPPKVTVTPEQKPIVPTPQEPGPNAPNSAYVQYLTSPVAPGDNANIVVTTGPQAACTVVMVYGTLVSHDSGLGPKTADIHGSVQWTWTVDKAAPAGKWVVKVTCIRNKKAAYVEGYLEVTK